MQTLLVMTVIGRDRPGLVELIADVIAAHEGSWLESRMAHLGGQFAGILRLEVPTAQETALVRALEALRTQGLAVVVQPDPGRGTAPSRVTALLDIVGQDRPGIVRQISHALARHGVNVEDLHTECVSAPMSGETLFKAAAKLHIPPGVDVRQLREALECLAADLVVDLSLAELTHIRPRG
jgi:glycine cleavage system regulatory protein